MGSSSYDPQLAAAFTAYDPVPEEGIERMLAIARTGKIFRYSGATAEDNEVALLERDFAKCVGARYALAVNSCTQAIELALRCIGVKPGDQVLFPAFTFTAVPSAIKACGAMPLFVECNRDYRIDIDDLRRKVFSGSKVLLLSHMRGHIADMDEIMRVCDWHRITLIEDAAHALGSYWQGKPVGSFGAAGCYSFQSNKIVNAGEGGMLVTNDERMMAEAIPLSGAYEKNRKKHFFTSSLLDEFSLTRLLDNVRMHNVTAAMARAQLPLLAAKGERYRAMYASLETKLRAADNRIELPRQHLAEVRIPDSVQFRVTGFTVADTLRFAEYVREAWGIALGPIAEPGNARAFWNWHYVGEIPALPQTRKAIETTIDLRLPVSLEEKHLEYLVAAIKDGIAKVEAARP